MKRPNLYFPITENCNIECEHCYLGCGPDKKDTTIPEKDFRSVIKHLPKVSLDLNLTGGEVFTIKNRFYSYLEYINYQNRRRERHNQGKIEVSVQTNGFWAKDDRKAKEILFDLLSFGVRNLDITSDDRFHEKQGIDIEKIQRLVWIAEESEQFENINLRGNTKGKGVIPLGRAKQFGLTLEDIDLTSNCVMCKGALDNYDLYIKPDGEVYACYAFSLKLPGNVIIEPLVDIVRKAREDETLVEFNYKGVKGLAKRKGLKKRKIKNIINKHGECGLCMSLNGLL